MGDSEQQFRTGRKTLQRRRGPERNFPGPGDQDWDLSPGGGEEEGVGEGTEELASTLRPHFLCPGAHVLVNT